MDALCDAATMCSAVATILSVITVDALITEDASPGLQGLSGLAMAFSWAQDLVLGGGLGFAVVWVPNVATRALLTRAIRRRFDGLREGDRIRLGAYADEAVLASRLDGSGGARRVFVVFMAWLFMGEPDKGVMDVTRDEFVHIASRIGGLWTLLSSRRLTRQPRCELVAMVREMALDEWHASGTLVAAAWRLERPARVIQRAVRRALSDPSYWLCRRRLQREWSVLTST